MDRLSEIEAKVNAVDGAKSPAKAVKMLLATFPEDYLWLIDEVHKARDTAGKAQAELTACRQEKDGLAKQVLPILPGHDVPQHGGTVYIIKYRFGDKPECWVEPVAVECLITVNGDQGSFFLVPAAYDDAGCLWQIHSAWVAINADMKTYYMTREEAETDCAILLKGEQPNANPT